MEDYLREVKKKKILKSLENGNLPSQLDDILAIKPRVEKIAIKDAKLRTFITDDIHRDELVAHVYDITYGTIRSGIDNLVVIDDSIVRGTTLKKSIIKMLDRLGPKKIVVVSSAPQIRFPDCYGIDMSRMGEFIAFNAAVELMKERDMEGELKKLLECCKKLQRNNQLHTTNVVKQVYKPFTTDEISAKISQLITPADVDIPVDVIFQNIENLHKACPNNLGDWYFTGDYPTPGGNKVVNKAFINYMEGRNVRGY